MWASKDVCHALHTNTQTHTHHSQTHMSDSTALIHEGELQRESLQRILLKLPWDSKRGTSRMWYKVLETESSLSLGIASVTHSSQSTHATDWWHNLQNKMTCSWALWEICRRILPIALPTKTMTGNVPIITKVKRGEMTYRDTTHPTACNVKRIPSILNYR